MYFFVCSNTAAKKVKVEKGNVRFHTPHFVYLFLNMLERTNLINNIHNRTVNLNSDCHRQLL